MFENEFFLGLGVAERNKSIISRKILKKFLG